MSVPKKKLSKRRTRARRSHHKVDAPVTTACPKCSAAVQPHHACAECGTYNGRDVMQTEAKTEAAVKNVAAKAAPKKEETAEEKPAEKPKKKEKKEEKDKDAK